jgi:hypothetical protein
VYVLLDGVLFRSAEDEQDHYEQVGDVSCTCAPLRLGRLVIALELDTAPPLVIFLDRRCQCLGRSGIYIAYTETKSCVVNTGHFTYEPHRMNGTQRGGSLLFPTHSSSSTTFSSDAPTTSIAQQQRGFIR